jgi:hypothetical protein
MESRRSGLIATLADHNNPEPADPSGTFVRWLTDPFGLYKELIGKLSDAFATAFPFVLVTGAGFLVLYLAARMFRRSRDRKASSEGRHLQILPPPEVDRDGAVTLWMALHALIRPRWKRLFFGQPHLAWELTTQGGEASLSVWVPASVPPGLVEQAIENSWPGAVVVETGSIEMNFDGRHVSTCELVLGEPEYFPLGEGTGKDSLRLVLGALSLINQNEEAAVQVLARPVTFASRHRMRSVARRLRRQRSDSLFALTPQPGRPQVDPVIDQDVRSVLAKAAAPLWEIVMRVAVASSDPSSARGKIHALAGAFSVFEGRNGLRRVRLRGGVPALSARSMPRGFLLSAHELASIANLPSAEAMPALERARARSVGPPQSLPKAGKPLGISDHSGHARPVALSVEDSRHHIHLIGETGTGKSTLIARMVLADAEAGRSAIVIDPKGDLVTAILERLPEKAVRRTCLLNPDDPETSVGLNVLQGDDPDLVVDHIVSVFRRIYEHAWGPRTDDIMRAACLTLIETPGATLAEVPLLLTHREIRHAIRFRRRDYSGLGDLGNFWDQYEKWGEQQRTANIAPLMNKLRAFLLRGPVRAMIGQSSPRLDMQKLINSGGLLLARIPKGTLGEETSRILGSFVVARVWQASMKRARDAEASRTPVSLYVDEMHNYLALPRSFEDILAEARGYGLSLLLAHQHLGQLPNDMRDALAANARTKVVFAVSPQDGLTLSGFFAPFLNQYDLSSLAVFQAACRPCINGGRGPAFTFRTEPLAAPLPERAEEVTSISARRFAVTRRSVEASLRKRQSQLLEQSLGLSAAQSKSHLREAQPKEKESAGDRPVG